MDLQPFTLNIGSQDIQDLKERLQRTRWPDEAAETGWEYGISLDFMKEIVHYWATEFDWNKIQDRILSYANYKADIDGMDIHFIHERGSGSNPLPLLIPHGWPSTFYEMLDLIPYLTHPEKFGGDPEDSFNVIIPSIPHSSSSFGS